MKLLHDFFRLHLAGRRTAAVRGSAGLPEFSVTVPAPLVAPLDDHAACAQLEAVAVVRREPASFLKTPRHRRLGSRRG